MYFRTFFFLLFVISTSLFFISSYYPEYTLNLCGSMCYEHYSLNYIQLTSLISSAITLILFVISNYFAEKHMLLAKEKLAVERLNIEQIHAELEALKA